MLLGTTNNTILVVEVEVVVADFGVGVAIAGVSEVVDTVVGGGVGIIPISVKVQ